MGQTKKSKLVVWMVIALAIGVLIPVLGYSGAKANQVVRQAVPRSPEAPPLNLSLSVYASGFNSPVSIANAGDERLFIVEQDGVIKIIDANGLVLPTPFLDIDSRVDSSGNEEGLLGLVFHPDYANNGYFFVNYTTSSSRTRISRFQVTANPNIADPNSEDVLLTVNQPFSNHNAGDIHFGPDGYLYIPLGDGGSGGDPQNYAQTLTTLLGKVARIDIDSGPGSSPDCSGFGSGNYTIPASNPLDDGAGGTCDEIWAIGLRNPWRSSFDRLTGDFYIGDVGQGTWEEVDFQPAASPGGENYGWRCYEGNDPYNTSGCGLISEYIFPVLQYDSTSSDCSVVGGYVYRGSRYPKMYGRYLLADYCTGSLWDLEPGSLPGPWASNKYPDLAPNNTTTFGEGFDGELYLAIRSGTIYHIEEESPFTESIQLTKTVGTSPGVCADTDVIGVFQGTDVYYCFEVENTGDIILITQDLSDDKLGTILTDFSYQLTPGSIYNTVTAGLTISTTITDSTTNQAVWTSSFGLVSATYTDTAEVIVLPEPVNPAISLTKTVGTVPDECAPTSNITVFYGLMVHYCYEIENTGDITLTLHNLTDSQLGPILNDFQFILGPGEKVNTIQAGINVSTQITATTVNTATWAASLPGTGEVNASAEAAASVTAIEPPYQLHLPTVFKEN